MITLEKIIQEEFEGTTLDNIVNTLSAHNLYTPFSKAIKQINRHFDNINWELNSYGVLQVTHIATLLLVEINEYLKGFETKKEAEKREIQYIAGNICKQLFKLITEVHPKKQQKIFIQSLTNSLKESCEFKEYDYENLVLFLGLDTFAFEKWVEQKGQRVITPKMNEKESMPGYRWGGDENGGIERFTQILRELKICSNPDHFMALVKDPHENLAIELNHQRPAYVLQFLSCVKTAKLLKAYGGYGYYQVLEVHVKNFREVFLKGLEPKRRVDVVKAHMSYPSNSEKFNARLKDCC